jgi:hypothetical protein
VTNAWVRIDFSAQNPPEGTITSPDGAAPVPFQGWMGLLAELQQIADHDRAASPTANNKPGARWGHPIGGMSKKGTS